jgi:hypothetical protein
LGSLRMAVVDFDVDGAAGVVGHSISICTPRLLRSRVRKLLLIVS